MKRKRKDGIYVENAVVELRQEKLLPLAVQMIQLLVIALAKWAWAGILIEVFILPCNRLRVNSIFFMMAVLFYALFRYPAADGVKLFFTVTFYGLFIYSRLSKLANGFYIMENLAMDRISSYYKVQNLQFIADYTRMEPDSTLLLIMVGIPFLALLSFTVVRGRMAVPASIILLLPVCISFLLGVIPPERYLLVCVIGVFYLMRAGSRKGRRFSWEKSTVSHRINSKAAVWLSLACIFAFCIIRLFVTHKAYDNMLWIEEQKNQLQTSIMNFSIENLNEKLSKIKIFHSNVNYGGVNGGYLSEAGSVNYLNQEELRVTAPLQSAREGIYLKGFAGCTYTGERWLGHSEEVNQEYEKLQAMLPQESWPAGNLNRTDYGGQACCFEHGVMELEYKKAENEFLYIPYFTDFNELQEVGYHSDLYAAALIRKKQYQFRYYFNISFYELDIEAADGAVPMEYREYEKSYRDFVYQVYTVLPEKGLEDIKRDFTPEKLKNAAGSIMKKIYYVKNYLKKNTEYSLSPGILPKDKDFVEYFLYENKKGYCVHYASAATLLLRAMGVPARYAEGYAVGQEGITKEFFRQTDLDIGTSGEKNYAELSVRDYNAHAWVEVYFDYVGWIPVEFTPGSTVNYNDTLAAGLDRAVLDYRNQKEKEQSENQISSEPAVITPYVTQLDEEEAAQENSVPEIEKEQKKRRNPGVLFIVAGLSLLIILYIVRYKHRRLPIQITGEWNKKAILMFRDIECLMRFCHALPKKAHLEEKEACADNCLCLDLEELGKVIEIGERARFGREMLSRQEAVKITVYRNWLFGRIANHITPFRKLILYLLWIYMSV